MIGRKKEKKRKESENPVSFTISIGILIVLVFAFKSSILDANNIPTGSMIPTLKIGDFLFVNKMRYSLRIPYTEIEILHIDDPARGDIITFIPPSVHGDDEKKYVKRVTGMPGDRIRIRNIGICQLDSLLGRKPQEKRAFHCDPNLSRYPKGEPTVAFIEYKENDQGEWKHYNPLELSDAEAKAVLTDSDDDRFVIHPDFYPQTGVRELPDPPVLFKENTGGKIHYIVETSTSSFINGLCDDIEINGCVIPREHYLAMGDNRDNSTDSRFIGYIHRKKILGKAFIIYLSINWRDGICRAYTGLHHHDKSGSFSFDDFTAEDQAKYCNSVDASSRQETIFEYINRTIMYRIPRLSIRFARIGSLLK